MHSGVVAMQQLVDRRKVVAVGSGTCNGVHQPAVSTHTDVDFNTKEPLILLLGLVHLRVSLAACAAAH